MRYKGKTISEGHQIVVIPKGGVDIVFKAKAVRDYSRFDAMVPMPVPPTIQTLGEPNRPDFSDPVYQAQCTLHARKRTAFMILESLKDSEGIEWETVKINDPDTYLNLQTELDSVFSPSEQGFIFNAISTANGLNTEKIEEATESFLAGLAKAAET